MLGKTITVEDAVHELVKDHAFYEKSGGGVTLSGGEPTFQPEFAEALLARLNELGISTALDTCGLSSTRTLERLLPHTDLILFDVKFIDPVLHRQHTGVANQQILENLDFIRNDLGHHPGTKQLWIRTPLIPGATDTDENLSAIGHYLTMHLQEAVSRWELCSFNNLCRDQYIRLGLEWKYASTPLMTRGEALHCEQVAKAAFFHPQHVHLSGATRLEEPVKE